MAEGNGLLNRHRAKSLVAGSNPALSAITWRDRNHQFTSRRGCDAPEYQQVTAANYRKRCRSATSFEIKMGPNLVRARMAWPVGCGGENGSSERRHAEDEPERGWPPSGSACAAP